MKFFHLSDLHLGKRVNAFSMIEDQKYILNQIIELTDQEAPDAVIIAGDVYDKSIPSVEAVNLFDDFLVSLAKRNLQVFIISGNHDSAERVSYGGRVMEQSGIHISPRIQGIQAVSPAGSAGSGASGHSAVSSDSDIEANNTSGINTFSPADPNSIRPIRLEDDYGALNVYLFPYIHPSVIRAAWPDETVGNWTEAMDVLIRHANVDPEARNIAVSHQYVTANGVRPQESDSEQKHIGGLDNVEYSVFDAFDYVALGHLHGPQHIGRDTVRYAGSPLKYSFSEENQKKSVTVVEIKEKGDVEITKIPLAAKRDLKTLKGKFRELTSPEYTALLSSEDYYRIILTDEHDVDHAIPRLRSRFYTNLMVLDYDNARTKAHGVTEAQEETPEKEPSEILEELYLKQNGIGMTDFQKVLAASLIDEIWNMQ